MLADYFPALEAERVQCAVVAASAPHLKQEAYRALRAQLNAATHVLAPPAEPEAPREHIEIDREKAAAWFAEQGVRVVKSS